MASEISQPQQPNYEYLVNSNNEKIAELIPVPMELVKETEDFLISKGCDHIQFRRDMRQIWACLPLEK